VRTCEKAGQDIAQNERLLEALKKKGGNSGYNQNECKIGYELWKFRHRKIKMSLNCLLAKVEAL
jgi:hypothetical protein